MKYKVVVKRVQVAERFVHATSEEHAAEKIQEEFDRPYGYFGSWKTTNTDVEVAEAEEQTLIHPRSLSKDGALLLSVKEAAPALGIGEATLRQMMRAGDIEWVQVGSRTMLSRDGLLRFIDANTHRGYFRAE